MPAQWFSSCQIEIAELIMPIDWDKLKCRFGCDNPIGIFHVPDGCICWRDPVQALCMQHFITAESTGPITIIVDFRVKQ
jgi:hypothetical protein